MKRPKDFDVSFFSTWLKVTLLAATLSLSIYFGGNYLFSTHNEYHAPPPPPLSNEETLIPLYVLSTGSTLVIVFRIVWSPDEARRAEQQRAAGC